MNKKPLWIFTLLFFATSTFVEAQQPKIYKIGEVTARPGLRQPSEVFRGALRELGYIEGRT